MLNDRRLRSAVSADGHVRNLAEFFWPASIAIVGASEDASTIRGRILKYLLQREYKGKIYLVSARQKNICGRVTYASLRDIPEPIDLVLSAIPADAADKIVADCEANGAKFLLIFSSGFADQGARGAELQQRIGKLARAANVRICGPNTSGFFNVLGMIPATFARSVDSELPEANYGKLKKGNVAIVSQSAGLGFGQQLRCTVQQGLGFSYIVSTGNEVDLEVSDFVEYLIEDASTNVVLLLIEALTYGTRLAATASRARELGKPIVVAKFGRTAAGSRAAISHAARLSGSDAIYDAVFRRHGLVRVEDEEEMSDLAAAFSRCPLPKGNRVGIVTTSGGAGVWMADACEAAGLEVPVLDELTQSLLGPYLPSFGSAINPVDVTAQVTLNPAANNSSERPLQKILEILDSSPSVDALVFVANLSDGELILRERDAFANQYSKPFVLYTHTVASHATLELIWNMNLVCFGSTRRTARAVKYLVEYADSLARLREPEQAKVPSPNLDSDDLKGLQDGLCEYQAKALLSHYSFPVPNESLACTADEAVDIAAKIGGRVVLKIQSPDIPHKTDCDGVILAISGEVEVRDAFAKLMAAAYRRKPHAKIHGVLVQEMLPMGRELALGIVRDVNFGPILMAAMGGIYLEVQKDAVFEPLPVRRNTALAMLRRLRGWPVLQGFRGTPGADLDALSLLMERLSILVESSGDAVLEIDLNPVFVYDFAKGVVVVDALVVGSKSAN
jgi:acetate---CoA ligase (ADP-forming)